jgi:leucine dehydrogenase
MECRASIICGASQDQLADAETGSVLHANAILYCPDTVVSAGGAIGLHYRDAGTIEERISEIPRRLLTILEAAANDRVQPELVAEKMARSRLDHGTRADNHGMREPAVIEIGGLL